MFPQNKECDTMFVGNAAPLFKIELVNILYIKV